MRGASPPGAWRAQELDGSGGDRPARPRHPRSRSSPPTAATSPPTTRSSTTSTPDRSQPATATTAVDLPAPGRAHRCQGARLPLLPRRDLRAQRRQHHSRQARRRRSRRARGSPPLPDREANLGPAGGAGRGGSRRRLPAAGAPQPRPTLGVALHRPRARRRPLRARLPPLRRNASLGGSRGALCGLAALTRNTGLVARCLRSLSESGRADSPPAPALACGAGGRGRLRRPGDRTLDRAQRDRVRPLHSAHDEPRDRDLRHLQRGIRYLDGGTHGAWRDPQIVPRFTPLFVTPGIDEGTVDATLRREARDFAWEHPGYVAETSALEPAAHVRDSRRVRGRRFRRRRSTTGASAAPCRHPSARGSRLSRPLAVIGVLAILRTRPGLRGEEAGRRRVPAGPLFLWLIPVRNDRHRDADRGPAPVSTAGRPFPAHPRRHRSGLASRPRQGASPRDAMIRAPGPSPYGPRQRSCSDRPDAGPRT